MKKIMLLAALALTVAACGGGKKTTDAATDTAARTGMQVVALSDSLIVNHKADTVAFGRLREGESVVREVMVRNAGDKAMVITRVDLSCGCVDADYPKQPVMPGEQAPMTLTLDTRDLGGWVFKTVKVHTSLSTQSYLLCLTAEIE
jgi:hypothetical protein